MRNTGLVVTSLLLFTLHSPIARADEGLPAPITLVTNVLQLSPDQANALITMIQAREAALQPIAMKLQTDQQALSDLLESPSADPAAIGSLLIEIHSGQKQATALARDGAAAFEGGLSPEQRDRLQLMRQAAQVEPAIPAFRAVGLL